MYIYIYIIHTPWPAINSCKAKYVGIPLGKFPAAVLKGDRPNHTTVVSRFDGIGSHGCRKTAMYTEFNLVIFFHTSITQENNIFVIMLGGSYHKSS